jgi:cupin fold WbuC family metalloprotein
MSIITNELYSKVEPDLLCHYVVRHDRMKTQPEQRIDIVSEDNYIQCSSLRMHKGVTFRPHIHIFKKRTQDVIAQESWVVIEGSVECHFFDLDGSLLDKVILYPGDASFTLRGGHTYLILEDNTLVYEYKTGPYEGRKYDKIFLDELMEED